MSTDQEELLHGLNQVQLMVSSEVRPAEELDWGSSLRRAAAAHRKIEPSECAALRFFRTPPENS